MDRLLRMTAFVIMQLKKSYIYIYIYIYIRSKQTEAELPDLHKSFPKTFEKLELLQELVGSSLEIPSG
jgi:hypothetical protein